MADKLVIPGNWHGQVTPMQTPMQGETVFDPDRGSGVVSRRIKGGTIFVKFGSEEEIMYTLRAALGVWKAFPGNADSPGLRSVVL